MGFTDARRYSCYSRWGIMRNILVRCEKLLDVLGEYMTLLRKLDNGRKAFQCFKRFSGTR